MVRAEEFQVIYVGALPSRRESVIPHYLGVGYTKWLPAKESSMERGKESNFIMAKTDKCYLSRDQQWWYSHIISLHSWYDMMKWHFSSIVFSQKYINSNLAWEKHLTNFSRRTCEKNIPAQYSSKPSRSSKAKKVSDTVAANRSLRRHEDYI